MITNIIPTVASGATIAINTVWVIVVLFLSSRSSFSKTGPRRSSVYWFGSFGWEAKHTRKPDKLYEVPSLLNDRSGRSFQRRMSPFLRLRHPCPSGSLHNECAVSDRSPRVQHCRDENGFSDLRIRRAVFVWLSMQEENYVRTASAISSLYSGGIAFSAKAAWSRAAHV